MLRWVLLVCLVGCDKGPIREHRILYEMSGLGSSGPITYRALVDLDRASLVGSINAATTERVLDAKLVKELGDLASCARDEKPGPDPHVTDLYERMVLEGDQTKVIGQPGPMTSPCASRLAEQIETLAGWHD